MNWTAGEGVLPSKSERAAMFAVVQIDRISAAIRNDNKKIVGVIRSDRTNRPTSVQEQRQPLARRMGDDSVHCSPPGNVAQRTVGRRREEGRDEMLTIM